MIAWQVSDAFGFENLVQKEIAEPAPGPGQVALRMLAASVNYRDTVVVQGVYGPHITTPIIPFSDGVGEVVAVGEGVSRVAVGDRVCPTFFQGWISGEPSQEKSMTSLGGPVDGALSQRMVLNEEGMVKVPDFLTDEEAACLPCAALTAWSALVTEGKLKAGDIVLLQGTGGVSLFALQFAKMLGATVIMTSSSDAKLARATEMGADFTINYKDNPQWAKPAKAFAESLSREGVDHVVEVGGAATLNNAIRAVRVGGRISLIGVLSGPVGEFPLPLVLMRNVCVQGITVGSREGFEAMVRAIAAHNMRPVVDKVFAFDDAPAAMKYLLSGQHFGKVCIKIA